jgi:hypothetical protein
MDRYLKLRTQAVEMHAELQGQENVYWNNILALFDQPLIKEHEKGSLEDLDSQFTKDGKPTGRYLDYTYRKAAETILEPNPTQAKLW